MNKLIRCCLCGRKNILAYDNQIEDRRFRQETFCEVCEMRYK